ncbi:MAG: translation initiation factor IF-2 [Verrucomicrobiaceae bacterium]|nr:translation initiation factor IF-2 [Verrucomicrobiaceae bacterium]
MPSSKSSSSKSTSKPAASHADESSVPKKKAASKTVVDLIEDKPAAAKKAPGPPKSASAFTPLGKTAPKKAPAAAPEPPAAPKQSVDEAKKGALDLFDEEEKRKEARAKKKEAVAVAPIAAKPSAPGAVLHPISLLNAPPTPVAPPPAVEAVAAPTEGVDSEDRVLHLKPPIIVKELAERMGIKPFKLIADLITFKVFVTADKAIEIDVAEKLAEKHGFKIEREKREKGAGVHKVEEVIVEPEAQTPEQAPVDEMELRAPIITFMGHVDHGKTSLLDSIRKTHVVTGEAGGITQHIGAYSVIHGGRPITFIDTPGHAAFSAMRARGANVTDIVVLVIAADDGIMPQTREALSHAKAANVTLMVAINKCDLPTANVMRVKSQLQEIGLAPVDWGGEIECLEVSATKGIGLDNLLETMALQAEVLELKSNPQAPARATVIESSVQAGKGPVATVIVRQGTLKVGQPFICGPHWGKVKAMNDDHGKPAKEVRPGMPCELIGFSDMPNVGDEVVVMDNERQVKKLSEERVEELRQRKLNAPRRSTLETLFANLEEGEKKTLNLVIKGDVQGSVEAIVKCLNDIKTDKVKVNILHAEAGPVSESDVILASASDAIVIGFNTKVENKALAAAKAEGVQVKLYSIIYELVDQIKEAMQGLLDPITREKVIGHAKVKQVFKLTRGIVAGCQVTDGRIDRKARARVLRRNQPVYDGNVDTLRRFQDDVAEVRNGLECGIKLGHYTEYEEDDIIECYELEKIQQTL